MKAEYLVIHHTASSFGDVEEITKWHLARQWRTVGYNVVILNGKRKSNSEYVEAEDGLIEIGRGLDFSRHIDGHERGAHTLGYNSKSIGIAFVSTRLPTPKQWESLEWFCRLWKRIIPEIKIVGHMDLNPTKCPGFMVQEWLKEKRI